MTTATRSPGAAESVAANPAPTRTAVRTSRRAARTRSFAPWRVISDWLDRPLASLHLVLAVFLLMLGFGLLMVLSSSAATQALKDRSAFSVFTSQAVFAVLGLIAFVFVIRMPLRLIRSLSTSAVIVSLAMLVAVLIPGIGSKFNGARSWISIGTGFQFQPSEVAKLALLLWAAHVLASGRGQRPGLRSLLIPVAPVFLLMVGLVMLQPDLGTTVTLAIVFFAVLYFAGAPLWLFGAVAGAGVAGVLYLATSAGYRMDRVTAWLDPQAADPTLTYQSFQGFYAMGSGGIFGVGLGQSKMKWGRLPNADSDFIFAIIGEELGLIGTITVVLLFAVLAYAGLRIAWRNVDPFVKIVAAAATVWLVGQAAINIGYVVGLLPVTGIPLPMFSAGGTSLVITMVVFGLLANFARREPAAVAALHGTGPRGLAAFLGLGTPATGRSTPKRVTKRRAKRQARRAQAAQRRLAELDAYGSGWGDDRAVRRAGRGSRSGRAAVQPGRAGARQPGYRVRRALGFPVPTRPRYRVRRALGFPVPGERQPRAATRRTRPGAGRTVRQ